MNQSPRWRRWMMGGTMALLAAAILLPASASATAKLETQTIKTYSTYTLYTSFDSSPWANVNYWLPWGSYEQPQAPENNAEDAAPMNGDAQNGQAPGQVPDQPAPAPVDNTQGAEAGEKSQFATEVISLVNQERAKQGLAPLAGDTALNGMALAKAKDMNDNQYFSHTSPVYGSPFDMMTSFDIPYSYAGENIAMGQKSPAEVVTAWMNSEGHRANILNANYNLIGVGYYNGYWAQEFVGR